MKWSIFKLIQDAVNEKGVLPESFVLPDEEPEQKLKFAPGAMDGILFYHMGCAESGEPEGFPLLTSAIERASEGRADEAAALVSNFAAMHKVLGYIDLFQKYVIDNRDRITFGNVIDFAIGLMLDGTKAEAVKFGMSLLELIDWENQDKLKGFVRILALSDEFTLYAAFLMRCWEDPNRELFDVLKKVRGWGRVHIVRMIEADSEEIEEWLVQHGVDNEVLPAYSGLDCFEKVHYLERIREDSLDLERYRGLAGILDAMLDEAPAPGISYIENRVEVIQAFLGAAKARTDLAAQDYAVLLDLKDYIEKAENVDQESIAVLGAELSAYLQSAQVRENVLCALRQGEAFDVARRLGMDYQEYAFEAVRADFAKNAWLASQLMADDYRVQEIIDLAYERLDVEHIATGPADELGFGDMYEAHRALTLILQELRGKVGIGEKLIRPALKSPVVNNRNMALTALEEWVKNSGKTIQETTPQLSEYLQEIWQEEVQADIRLRMEKILKNESKSENGGL